MFFRESTATATVARNILLLSEFRGNSYVSDKKTLALLFEKKEHNRNKKKMEEGKGGKMKENGSICSGDSNPCPICLGPFLQESYLDTCFHKFCYKCILHWAKVVSGRPSSVKCPLCKTQNLSIIYGYDGCSFERRFMTQNCENSIANVSQYWKTRKYLQPNRWLLRWLRREIQALLQEEDVEIIVHHILGVIDSFQQRNEQIHQMKMPEAKQEKFKSLVADAARPFLAAKTDRFINELELFLASGFNIDAYDEVYMQQLGWNTPRAAGEAASAEPSEPTPVIPYLYIFDDDSDKTD
ncbi:uncharacterized protein LOC126673178 isoform X2 [Mercurialis annua]|uniref:uncharacterized protein LOC126673178 isoform X2 n=1 Tax=Mercurialis annua TaxID=3986 RepID=UPI0021609AD7|nr:uncharacterized protein LOC126673178 isoform X2 [Mercurialis annua]